MLEKLGFIINKHKSSLEPDTRCQYLGFIIDSHKLTVEPTADKRTKLIELIQKFSKMNKCMIGDFAKIVGSLVTCYPGIEYAKAHIKALEIVKNKALIQSEGKFDKKMAIPVSLHVEFNWWITNLATASRKIRDLNFDLEIYSDASMSG